MTATQKKQEQGWARKVHINGDDVEIPFIDITDRYLANILRSRQFRDYDKSALKAERKRRDPFTRTIRRLKTAERKKVGPIRKLARRARKALEKYRKEK